MSMKKTTVPTVIEDEEDGVTYAVRAVAHYRATTRTAPARGMTVEIETIIGYRE